MSKFKVKYRLIAEGELTVEANTKEQAKKTVKNIPEFELYDDSSSAEIQVVYVSEQ